jgi:hypothetical protein
MRLIYLSPVPWASFAQRPHKFVEWFHARWAGKVLWVDPYPTRLPQSSDFKFGKTIAGNGAKSILVESIPSWMTVLCPRSLPLEPLPGSGVLNRFFWSVTLKAIDLFVAEGECLIGIGKPSEFALQVLERHPDVPSLYDAMDDFSAFYSGLSRISMARREREVADRVTRISVSSTVLADRFDIYSIKLAVALNACAIEMLPPQHTIIKNFKKPVLGYVGTIGHWFDWSLVCRLAESNPSICIRVIGPVHVSHSGAIPRNVELLPACDHSTAIKLMGDFSVGLIPFKRIDLTASVDPIKYYEYRALGLPTISTSFGEMALRQGEPGVFLTEDFDDLSSLIEEAMEFEYHIDDINKFRSKNSWNLRFDSSNIIPSFS